MPDLVVHLTKPKGKVAKLLAERGIELRAILDDEGNVDRYLLSDRVAIERRTAPGFLKGIQDKTLFTSAIHLRERHEVVVLLLEGQVDYTYAQFDPQAVRGALTSMFLEYGVSVVATADAEDSAALIAMAARQEQVGIPEISLVPKRKAVDLPDLQRRVVEMFPGVGRVGARLLLQRFGSIERLLRCGEAELTSVPGIGPRKAAQILQVLHTDYGAVDTEADIEDALERRPELLLGRPLRVLARQHYIFGAEEDRHIVDLVMLDEDRRELLLVELKRGKPSREHLSQLRRYMHHAEESPLLRQHVEGGARLRGILATVEPGELRTDADTDIRILDREPLIQTLKAMRRERLGEPGEDPIG
ncbi:MAG: hypothetical protein GF320_12000 [Armatimonadia bacterium]|nr:hypothetical protein [Armatimonadia bacterium]